MRGTSPQPSRRDLLSRGIGAGAALSWYSAKPVRAAGESERAIVIHVGAPAGPPPMGAPVETSVPFARGRLTHAGKLAIYAPDGKPVPAQFRPALDWPGGSIRWLAAAFEASAGPGDYMLREGGSPRAADLVTERDGDVFIDTGALALSISTSGTSWMDLVLTRHDGKEFRASFDRGTRRITVEERGPVRARVRLEGQCHARDGEGLFRYIIRCTAFRGRSQAHLKVTWLNATGNPSEQLRDIRMVFPFAFEPGRLVFGCEAGVYDGPFLKGWPVYILQEDHNSYWAKVRNPDGRLQNLASGGCNGDHAPGWLYIENSKDCVGVWVPGFWEEYPNEIAVRDGELSVGLWPEKATAHLLSKPLLPANPQGTPYTMTRYRPILPHPYWAFLDAEKKCLDIRQGMAKTQEIVLSVSDGRDRAAGFESRWWRKALQPVRAHLDPRYIASTAALGPLSARNPARAPEVEALFDESYGWLDRHIDLLNCYGKFDYGDFKYFTPATDYLCTPGTKWAEMGEMPREGYWQNNEGDQLLGLLLYYFRTGNPAAWERCRIVARHLLDIDMRHHPYFGLYTHSYGHCYVATAEAGAPDHSWLLGLLVWAGVSGDPVVWNCVVRCGEYLAALKPQFIEGDARSTSVFLHIMCQFHRYTGEQKYLAAAKFGSEILLRYQNPDGSWPAYLGNREKRAITGFTDHAVMALADFHALTGEQRCRQPLERACRYVSSSEGVADGMDVSPLTIYGMALFSKQSRGALTALRKLRASQDRSPDPYGRGDTWAEWGVNNPGGAKETGRPPQFLGQTRPVTVGFVLSYGQPALAMAGISGEAQ